MKMGASSMSAVSSSMTPPAGAGHHAVALLRVDDARLALRLLRALMQADRDFAERSIRGSGS